MSVKTPATLRQKIKRAKRVAIVTHGNPDGDAIGSMLALARALGKAGKMVSCLLPEKYPSRYHFLFAGKSPRPVQRLSSRVDLTFILDCGDLTRAAGLPAENLVGSLVNIDHHRGNPRFGELNMVDAKASSTGELVEQVIRSCGLSLDARSAECLYTALLTDTGSFQHASTSPATFRLAERLVVAGASPTRAAAMLYQQRSAGDAKLLSRVIGSARLEMAGQVVWAALRQSDMLASGVKSEDVEGEDYLTHLRSLRGAQVAALLREMPDGQVRASLRCKQGWRIDQVAARLGGGGHKMAAGCTISGGIETARRRLFKTMRELLPALKSKPAQRKPSK
jgi:phosphoesterase RecJ-like protein